MNLKSLWDSLNDKVLLLLGSKLSAIESVDLSGCVHLNEKSSILSFLENISTVLDSIWLKDCEISDDTVKVLCRRFSNLKVVNLSGCEKITNASCTELGKLKKLENLNIAGCRLISNEGIRQLALSNIVEINLGQLYQIASGSFLPLIPQLTSLKSIVLRRTNVNDEVVREIATYCSSTLESINLEYCPDVTNASIKFLIIACSKLHVLIWKKGRNVFESSEGLHDRLRTVLPYEVKSLHYQYPASDIFHHSTTESNQNEPSSNSLDTSVILDYTKSIEANNLPRTVAEKLVTNSDEQENENTETQTEFDHKSERGVKQNQYEDEKVDSDRMWMRKCWDASMEDVSIRGGSAFQSIFGSENSRERRSRATHSPIQVSRFTTHALHDESVRAAIPLTGHRILTNTCENVSENMSSSRVDPNFELESMLSSESLHRLTRFAESKGNALSVQPVSLTCKRVNSEPKCENLHCETMQTHESRRPVAFSFGGITDSAIFN